MTGNHQNKRTQALTRLKSLLLVALLSAVGMSGFLYYQRQQVAAKEAAAAAENGWNGRGDPFMNRFSSRVLNQMAAEDARFAAWLEGVETGAALAYISQLPTYQLQQTALKTVMDHVVRNGDMDGTSSFFNALGDPMQKNMMAVAMAQMWGAYQPELAGQWLNKVTDLKMLKQAVSGLVSTRAFDDPSVATRWASQQPYENLHNPEVLRGTRIWATNDPVVAADWVLSLQPPSPRADPAIQGLVSVIMYAYPQGAMI